MAIPRNTDALDLDRLLNDMVADDTPFITKKMAKASLHAAVQVTKRQERERAMVPPHESFPPWAREHWGGEETVSPLGMLWLRLCWKDRNDMRFEANPMNAKFHLGKVGVIDLTVTREGKYSIFVTVDGHAMLIEDDAELFPSDSLLVKLHTLKD